MNNTHRTIMKTTCQTATINATGQRVILVSQNVLTGVWRVITPFAWLPETQQQAYPNAHKGVVLMMLMIEGDFTVDGQSVEVTEITERTDFGYMGWKLDRHILQVDGVDVAYFTTGTKNAV